MWVGLQNFPRPNPPRIPQANTHDSLVKMFFTLRAILNGAIRAGHLEDNPCQYADRIRGIVPRQRFLTSEEHARLLLATEEIEPWLTDFVIWCLHSGMRKGEVQALQSTDIRALDDGRTFVLVGASKSDEPRIVTCTETMKEILVRQNGRRVKDDPRIFPVSAMNLRRKWEKARIAADLTDVTIHDLRRTHITHAAAARVDLRTLAGRTGHTDLKMLQKHYAVFTGSADAEAAVTIDRIFTQGQRKGDWIED